MAIFKINLLLIDFYITEIDPVYLWGKRWIIEFVTTVWTVCSKSWLVITLTWPMIFSVVPDISIKVNISENYNFYIILGVYSIVIYLAWLGLITYWLSIYTILRHEILVYTFINWYSS